MEWIIGIACLLVGGGAGATIGWLLFERRARREHSAIQTELALARQRAGGVDGQLKAANDELGTLRKEVADGKIEAARLTERVEAAGNNLEEQRELLHNAEQKLRDVFAGLSREALNDNNENFLKLAKAKFDNLATEAKGELENRKTQIDVTLSPIKSLLEQFGTHVSELEKARQTDYNNISQQLTAVSTTQLHLSKETSQLVTALRRSDVRGRWGELTLRRLLELAGLADRCTFFEQVSVEGPEGTQRPDCVVRLPRNREIVIDSKAVLTAFLDSAAASDEQTRANCLQRHAGHMRERVKELAEKEYWKQFGEAAEFVVMFLPGEPFLYAAVQVDPTLIEDALAQRVIVASPTSLLGILRVVEATWRQEQIAENFRAVQQIGTELYERIGKLADHFRKLGSAIETTTRCYNDAVGSMERMVISQARKMAQLGVRASDPLPELEEIERLPRPLGAVWNSHPASTEEGGAQPAGLPPA